MRAALTEIHLDNVADQIESANTTFEELFIERLGETSGDGSKSTKELIQETDEAYKTLGEMPGEQKKTRLERTSQ